MLLLYIPLLKPLQDIFAPLQKKRTEQLDPADDQLIDQEKVKHQRRDEVADYRRSAQTNYSLERRTFF